MAYVVVTEDEAAAEEHLLEGLNRLKGVLDANAAVLKSGDRAVAPSSIQLGAQASVAQFPAIQIEGTLADESPWTLSAENRLRLTYRVVGYDVALGDSERLAQNLMQLTDRIATVMRFNPTLDGFCHDARVARVVLGRLRGGPRTTNPVFAPHPILAAQMDVVIEKGIARP